MPRRSRNNANTRRRSPSTPRSPPRLVRANAVVPRSRRRSTQRSRSSSRRRSTQRSRSPSPPRSPPRLVRANAVVPRARFQSPLPQRRHPRNQH